MTGVLAGEKPGPRRPREPGREAGDGVPGAQGPSRHTSRPRSLHGVYPCDDTVLADEREPVRVLVVEDEVDLAEALAEGIRRDGYAVDIALDGRDAM